MPVGPFLIALGALIASPESSGGLEVEPAELKLEGPEDRAQVLVLRRDAQGHPVDLTCSPSVRYESLDARVARVDASGRVEPTGEGETSLLVRSGTQTARVRVVVADWSHPRPVSFAGEVVPIFSKRGCSSGACHGKTSGQNGFRLSLFGFDPRQDYESLVREGRGRRVFPAAPGSSLLLLKPTASLAHGGGRRFEVGSPEYRTIARWIAQGMPLEAAHERRSPSRIEVSPARRRIAPKGEQQLRVTAHFADGSTRDVTHLAQYQSNAPDLVVVDDRGRVEALDGVGEATVLARFGGRVAVARATVPRDSDPSPWQAPTSNNPIDPLVFGKLRELGIPPSASCTDSEFARRSSLDICGILPAPRDVAALEASVDPEKRARWVDRLLARPEYADLFAMKWSAILRNRRSLGRLSQPGTFAFHAWIREALAENRPYDRFVAELLTARGDASSNPPVVWYRQVKTAEEQADDTAQLFLGLRLQCARCHHHPFESWGQDDYYGFAAFFSRVGRKPGPDPVTPRLFVLRDGEATDPLTGKTYPPRLLGGPELAGLGPDQDPRRALADWLRRPDNSFFARAIVNRYWKHFFGRGLVEPEDDLRVSNPPSNPELLDTLADDFIRHGYDLKHLVRTIATSRAYDRSSLPHEGNEPDRRNFARYYPRRLDAEVLLDAIGVVTGRPEVFDGLPRSLRAVQLPDEGVTSEFLDTFGRPRRESVCECERSAEANLSQSLLLLNSADLQRMLRDPEARPARWANEARPDAEDVEELYRLAYARPPTAEEREVCLAYLASGPPRERYEDLVWTVINTKEFLFNH